MSRACSETEEARRDGTHKKKNQVWKERFLPLENEKSGWKKKRRRREGGTEGRREDETVRSLCRCDGGLALGWSSDGEQSVPCGHGWTTGALHESSPFFFFFLQRGKEMLMFTLTTSRLYNVNVKLHRRVQSHPPCLYTSFIYIFKNTALTREHWHFCLFTLCKL